MARAVSPASFARSLSSKQVGVGGRDEILGRSLSSKQVGVGGRDEILGRSAGSLILLTCQKLIRRPLGLE